jgi:D-alanyl-D-alanine carboxypeptidase
MAFADLLVNRLPRKNRAPVSSCSTLLVALLSLLIVTAFTLPHQAQASIKAIVVDAYTGEVIYSRRADQRHYPASLTKMMTLYLTFEAIEKHKLDLDQMLRVSRRAAGQTPSKLGLRRGKRISVENAILAVTVKSANDAATVLAEALGETEIEFAIRMTQKARALGMKRTRFRNATGLPNRRQISTARDMALLSAALFHKFPQYYHYFSRKQFSWGKRVHRSHNKLLGRYPGMDGLKTGYIRASGFNIATSATKDGRRLIAVVLGERSSKLRNAKVAHLMNVGFNGSMAKNKGTNKKTAARVKPVVKSVIKPVTRPSSKREKTVLARLDRILNGPVRGLPAKAIQPQNKNTSDTRHIKNLADQVVVDDTAPGDANWWGIQVGAYKRYASAQRRVHKAASVLPKILMHARPSIDLVKKRGRDLYRARLLGLRQDDARTACRILKGKAFSCVPISPNGDTVLKLASR